MSGLILNVSEVSISRGDFEINGVDFRLQSGDIMGLVGKSGSGKTSIIEAIIGFTKPVEGGIWAETNGKEVNLKQISGYSPQEKALYPSLTVEENIHLFADLRKVSKGELKSRSERLLRKLKIYEDRKKLVKDLSGGMKTRADLICALVHDPDFILLDEPFSGIDPPQRQVIWKNLQAQAEKGKIVIVTSHMLEDISTKCNKFGLVQNGNFYRTFEIRKMMEESRYEDIETFLENAFRI